jgi:thiol-disulfide isomerase/thioredoxin
MKSALQRVMLVALAAVLTAPLRAEEPWFLEFEAGRAAAKAQGKDLLIDFGGSDWCLPCKWLKERVLSKAEFIERAGGTYVLVDIDLPVTNRVPIAADRKRRYEELQQRYAINSFPTVVLAAADGRPYARTTYREAFQTPETYWNYLAPLRERGARLRAALSRAEPLKGESRAAELASALSEVDPRFISRFYADRVAELRSADPSDSTGYLAFLDGRRALDEFQAPLDLHTAAIDPAAVDSLIGRAKLRGEALQEALVLRAAGEVLANEDRRALASFKDLVKAQTTRTRFDRGDYIPLDAASLAVVQRRIAAAEADPGDGVALYYSLHRMFQFDLPNPYEWSCGQAFQPNVRVREAIGDRYGRALIRSTEALKGEARAKALAKGLDGTFFVARGAIREIVLEIIPGLVGKPAAKALMPGEFYPRWID